MTEVPPAIVVRDLRKVYGAKAAVDGLNLIVPQGCFFGFLGPNGGGEDHHDSHADGAGAAHLRHH